MNETPLPTSSRAGGFDFTADETHGAHMRRVALWLALACAVIFLINRQWLRANTLLNSPAFDALVYQNQSYDDYWLIRTEGFGALFDKYTKGQWHVPPLYMLSGTCAYLMFGLDPANFYMAPAVWLFLYALGVYGFIHFWTGRILWAALGTALVLSMPSVVSFGLRVSQIDFSVGAAFTWATYLLVRSEGLRHRQSAVAYMIFASACLLLKSSILPYFLAHAALGLLYGWNDPENRRTRALNLAIVAAAVALMTGWFFAANLRQVLHYYTTWGTKLSAISRTNYGIVTPLDNLLFYLKAFAAFHLQKHYLVLQGHLALWMVLTLGWAVYRFSRYADEKKRWAGLSVSAIWLLIPYAILTMYGSKAFSVDFPFLAVYYIVPILALDLVFRGRAAVLAALVIVVPLLALQGRDQINLLLKSEKVENWREREVLADIFHDAESRQRERVVVSNAFIHAYLTSENLRFFVMNGTFAAWRGRYSILPLSYYEKADAYYQFLTNADYVLAKSETYLPTTHPDNVLAPEVNQRLEASPLFQLFKSYDLPDASRLMVYRNVGRGTVHAAPPMTDGWIAPRHALAFSESRVTFRVRIKGEVILPQPELYPVTLFLEDENGRRVVDVGTVTDGGPKEWECTVTLDDTPSAREGVWTLYLNSDRPFRPVDYGVSSDNRLLLMRLNQVTAMVVSPESPASIQ